MPDTQDLNIRNGLEAALRICEAPLGRSLIDVGAGTTDHGVLFRQFYAEAFSNDLLEREDPFHITGDILTTDLGRKFDVVYASNILEHQKNVGHFLERLIDLCADDGHLVVIVPHQHLHKLLFGHLTSWTVGILVYNLVMAGIDCSEARLCRGRHEISIIVRNRKTEQIGDIARSAAVGLHWEADDLKKYFPFDFFQGCTADMDSIGWPESYKLACKAPMKIHTMGDDIVDIKPGVPFEIPQAKAKEPWWYKAS
ncbi:hypothetical protein RGUI_3163 [Rhodovulum sp. P5]|uniref:methyltransferase domain-containing protein n=1 Tax=Rhodovulum sp. P5 TaxID=1564506 RepID=UPI0009C3E111|nr:methyltransferase domain-containing protein [Rhodovulum sp. P5]ARE41304.1 hypothetical protein RGUI_3163 [Rhodovulum sp. P5]